MKWLIFISIISLSGCALFKPNYIPHPQTAPIEFGKNLSKGNTIKVITKDGETLKFKIRNITDTTIEGRQSFIYSFLGPRVSIPLDNVVSIEKRKITIPQRVALGVVVLSVTEVVIGSMFSFK